MERELYILGTTLRKIVKHQRDLKYDLNDVRFTMLPAAAASNSDSGLDTSLKMTKGLTRGHSWKSSNENVSVI